MARPRARRPTGSRPLEGPTVGGTAPPAHAPAPRDRDAMRLQRLDHVGVVVDDLDEAARLLGDGFGLELAETIDRGDLRVAFYRCGEVRVELIEVRDAEQRRA